MEEPIPRTEPAAAVLRGHWPADVQVFLRPGVGGERRYGGAFAPTAWHVYDELAERGVSVAYAVEDQRPDCVILLESADWWGPVLLLARDLGVGVVGTAIYAGLKRIIFGAREELGDGLRAHLDVQELTEEMEDGGIHRVRTISLEGDSETVLTGLREILGVVEDPECSQ
jgi:hypothetical protein